MTSQNDPKDMKLSTDIKGALLPSLHKLSKRNQKITIESTFSTLGIEKSPKPQTSFALPDFDCNEVAQSIADSMHTIFARHSDGLICLLTISSAVGPDGKNACFFILTIEDGELSIGEIGYELILSKKKSN